MQNLLESGVLNRWQQEVLRKLIFATENGSENYVAAYVATMDEAARSWAKHIATFLPLLG